MSHDTILVLGATGKTGRRLLPRLRLRLRGLSVRSASRSSATAFDWSDPTGWDAALRGAGAAYLVSPSVLQLYKHVNAAFVAQSTVRISTS